MTLKPLMIIAKAECTAAARLWWIRLFTIAFALLTIAIAQAASVVADTDSANTFARLTIAVLPLALMLVTLAALLIGVSSVSNEHDGGGFLFAMPVSRFEVVLGRWIGQAAALWAALATGFGTGAMIVSASVGIADLHRFAVLVSGCALLALAFLSIATLIGVSVSTKGAALGTAVFVWFLMVILYDAGSLALALWLTGRLGTRLLFGSVFGNAVDLVRILILTLAGTPNILGVAGESWIRSLGGPGPVAALAALALSAWIAVPLFLAARIANARDL